MMTQSEFVLNAYGGDDPSVLNKPSVNWFSAKLPSSSDFQWTAIGTDRDQNFSYSSSNPSRICFGHSSHPWIVRARTTTHGVTCRYRTIADCAAVLLPH